MIETDLNHRRKSEKSKDSEKGLLKKRRSLWEVCLCEATEYILTLSLYGSRDLTHNENDQKSTRIINSDNRAFPIDINY